MAIFRRADVERESGGVRRAVRVVAVAAVDVEVGARTRVQRGARVFPVRVARHLGQGRQAAEVAELRQVLELVRAAVGVVVVLVDVARLRADRVHLAVDPVLRVAALALALVGHHVVEVLARVVRADQGQRQHRAGARQGGFGLRVVPHVRDRRPAVLAMHQDARLDQAYVRHVESLAGEVARVVVVARHVAELSIGRARVIERLADHRADREVQRVGGAVLRRRALRHPHGAQLVRVVGEQRRVEVVRHHAVVELQPAVVHLDHMPVAEFRRTAVGMERHRRHAALATGQQQQGEQGQCVSCELHHPHAFGSGSSTTGGSFGSVHWYGFMSVPGFL